MDKYKIMEEVGSGAFGNVWRAVNTQTGEVVAIKRMKQKYGSWDECMSLREVKSLRVLNHPNIVKLREVIMGNETLFFVFEYVEHNLYEVMKDRKLPFSEAQVRSWCLQVFKGLVHVHRRGYIHRDLKPENMLVSGDLRSVKLADFGLAREIDSKPPYTEYVSTRWYRAPEILLRSARYGPAVDMWAMGAIMVELLTLFPLFPGSNEVDQMHKICSILGTPTRAEWPEGHDLANALRYQLPNKVGVDLRALLPPSVSDDAVDLIGLLCIWDPNKRPTAAEVLQHRFFRGCYYVPPHLRSNPHCLSADTDEDNCFDEEEPKCGGRVVVFGAVLEQPPLPAQPIKAGGWHRQPAMLVDSSRNYRRKVAG